MNTNISFEKIALSSSVKITQAKAVYQLYKQGFTIPFISRYRKEQTGSLNEVEIETVINSIKKEESLIERKKYVLQVLESLDKNNHNLISLLDACETIEEVEDFYIPFKKQRKTLADIAIEKGLEPLAKILLFNLKGNDSKLTNEFIAQNKLQLNIDEAIEGAQKIVAKWINESAEVRKRVRELFREKGILHSNVISTKKEEAQNFKDYFDFTQPIKKIPAHRLLAILKGYEEKYLRVKVEPEFFMIEKLMIDTFKYANQKSINRNSEFYLECIKDSYKRLLQPSLENETLNHYKEIADEVSIEIFAGNLKQILLAAPIEEQPIMAIDPGFRSGCKMVVLNAQGDIEVNETIFPFEKQKEAVSKILNKLEIYKIKTIAIGNGKGGRELQTIIERLKIKELNLIMVNESGASVYSASSAAREEFPNFDVTVRGAISIGRRLLNPMAELVKIDPKVIGVGQYQHLVDQKLLQEKLEQVVSNCVNQVGVNINSAGKYLLKYVSGINDSLATKIVDYRKVNGRFKNRMELLKIEGLGDNKFLLSAGFLKIENAENPLDSTRIHPEHYSIVDEIKKELGIVKNDFNQLKLKIDSVNFEKYYSSEVGKETFLDIVEEIKEPGKEIRKKSRRVKFSKDVTSINHLHEGMELEGIVTNITAFGCFVDIGVQVNGLIHISKLSSNFISSPSDIISMNQIVLVKIFSVEIDRKRIQLELISML